MKKASLLIIVFLFSTLSVLGNKNISDSLFNEYKVLNDSELRLPEFKDNDEILRWKLMQLEVINESRDRRKRQAVKLDILASRVANKMCKEASDKGFVGHWNTAGEKPYHRYAFAGGHDHVSENAYGESIKTIGFSIGSEDMLDSLENELFDEPRYSNDSSTVLYYMKKGHGEFMKEKAPYDGHKQTVLNQWHNYVGIGYYMGKDNFRYYEEFTDQYYEFLEVPTKVNRNEEFTIKLKTQEGQYLYYLVAYYEKALKSKKASLLSFKGSYSDYSNKTALEMEPWELPKYRTGQVYELKLKFKKPGLYYIQMYQDKKEIKKPKSYNTANKCQASGIVIRVE